MSRKKILWLTSWYPNKNDRFDGDFIQRHARAAAIYQDVHVIFVTDAAIDNAIEEELRRATGLTEEIIYIQRQKGILGRIAKQWKWKNIYQEAVKKYIERNGIPDLVHVHIPWKAGLVGLWMKKKYQLPFILSEHWNIYNNKVHDNFFKRSKFSQHLIKNCFDEATTVVTVSKFLANSIENTIGIRPVVILPNVVDTTLFYHKEEKYSRFSFIHVSNMVPVKNVTLILQAFQIFKQANLDADVQLIMIGNRDDEYVDLAKNMGLLNTSVYFRGEVAYSEVAEEMRRCHCMVLFSDSETFSCVTAEALCCGLPVIASNVGALPELIKPSNGVLVPVNDTKALTVAMLQ
ncbi:MAG: glycosyltransferase, partial [Flavisolibacter sp.]